MKFNIQITSIILAITALTGCGSTSGAKEHRPIKLVNTKPYEWSNDVSYAMNIAKMVQPFGVGYGVEDIEDGTKANNNIVGAGGKTVSALAGFAVGGFKWN